MKVKARVRPVDWGWWKVAVLLVVGATIGHFIARAIMYWKGY